MAASAKQIEVPEEDRAELERIVRSTTGEVRMVERAQIVLYAAEGHSAQKIGQMVGCATVVSIDEKTGIQAKAPTKPDTLAAPGKPPRREHEYVRNGTQCLFACLNVKEGEVLGMPSKTRNRHDLIRFLDQLDSEIPDDGREIVAVSDNLSTRTTKGTRGINQQIKRKDH